MARSQSGDEGRISAAGPVRAGSGGKPRGSPGPRHTVARVAQNAESRARGDRPSGRPGESVPPAVKAVSQPPPPRGSGANQACLPNGTPDTRSPAPTGPNQLRPGLKLSWERLQAHLTQYPVDILAPSILHTVPQWFGASSQGLIHSQLERDSRPIGQSDFLIPAHARAIGATLVEETLGNSAAFRISPSRIGRDRPPQDQLRRPGSLVRGSERTTASPRNHSRVDSRHPLPCAARQRPSGCQRGRPPLPAADSPIPGDRCTPCQPGTATYARRTLRSRVTRPYRPIPGDADAPINQCPGP